MVRGTHRATGNKNGIETHFERDFSPLTIQTLTLVSPKRGLEYSLAFVSFVSCWEFCISSCRLPTSFNLIISKSSKNIKYCVVKCEWIYFFLPVIR